ncbi:hypothetical protein [Sphingomonas sp. BAUL-RG-20F-R05-02]|uniref:hypothetical protein n=1 Tax=Sphingomonas sp. BAUL-RG-20F-R05-02 TaxID=2914830 RepID=UPI001F58003F|nr:hypothetical protein [Sphingomonas sp. BAUL-RG-20F-R05-02]
MLACWQFKVPLCGPLIGSNYVGFAALFQIDVGQDHGKDTLPFDAAAILTVLAAVLGFINIRFLHLPQMIGQRSDYGKRAET